MPWVAFHPADIALALAALLLLIPAARSHASLVYGAFPSLIVLGWGAAPPGVVQGALTTAALVLWLVLQTRADQGLARAPQAVATNPTRTGALPSILRRLTEPSALMPATLALMIAPTALGWGEGEGHAAVLGVLSVTFLWLALHGMFSLPGLLPSAAPASLARPSSATRWLDLGALSMLSLLLGAAVAAGWTVVALPTIALAAWRLRAIAGYDGFEGGEP